MFHLSLGECRGRQYPIQSVATMVLGALYHHIWVLQPKGFVSQNPFVFWGLWNPEALTV